MPGFDGTGPMGMGPMTGGGFGPCNPATGGNYYGQPVYGAGRGGIPWGGGRGRAFGGGRGWFRGRGNWFAPPYFYGQPPVSGDPGYSAEDEKKYLQDVLSSMKDNIERIQSRLDELASSEDSK